MTPRDVQRLLAAALYYTGAIDGDVGDRSLRAIDAILTKNAGKCVSDPGRWAADRRLVGAGQLVLSAMGYEPGEIDGYDGHNTQEALAAWDHARSYDGKAETLPQRAEATAPKPVAASRPFGPWPRQKDCPTFYGPAGGPNCTAGSVKLPFPFVVAWNTSQRVSGFRCHAKVADAFTSVFAEAGKHYGEKQFRALRLDLFGGCYNFRKMRGGTAVSMHAYGIAVDLDPERNQLRWAKDRATFAKPDYEAFWKIVEAHGATSLGRARNFDWMHFQFAGL